MTPSLTINLLRALFIVTAAFVGATVGEVFTSQAAGAAGGIVFGLLIVLFDRLLKGFSLRIFSAATFGLVLGLVLGHLLLASDLLKYLSEEKRWIISLMIYGAFGYLGMMLAMRSNRDEFALVIPYVRFQQSAVQGPPLLVDTSIIIDGRIGDICAAGFLSGSLVVPRFVLDELQRLADSAEPAKRERGRLGLDRLNQLQKSPRVSVTVHEEPGDGDSPVDTKLIHLARLLSAQLISNDSSLCKIARLQNVAVLNLNDLAKAMRPSLSAGDELEIALVKEGRDAHQAVGYLPDGTMIVVNHARGHLGETVAITVAGALQTTAGRLFFAELKHA